MFLYQSVFAVVITFGIKSFSQHTFILGFIVKHLYLFDNYIRLIYAWYNYQTNKGVLTELFYTKLLQHIGMNNYKTLLSGWYRPVLLLIAYSKICEKVMYKRIYDFRNSVSSQKKSLLLGKVYQQTKLYTSS